MILLDYTDRRPIYEQLAEKIEELIFRNIWEPDSQLPSVRSLATELSINPNTIQRTYGELERRGYIYSVKGKGSFVSDVRNLRALKRKEWEKEFEQIVTEGRKIGLSLEDVIQQASVCYGEGGKVS